MPWIENVAWDDVKNGWHSDMGPNSVLIQITDPDEIFPVPKYKFGEVHQFKFWDAEKPCPFLGIDESGLISDEQAAAIGKILLQAKTAQRNVLVHCWAGICRSGAVVEVGSMVGLTPTNTRIRIPNVLVKTKIMSALGLYY